MLKNIRVGVILILVLAVSFLTPGSARADSGTELEGKTIVVDPGHGGFDPGAVGVTGLQEKTVALDTASKLAGYLESHGAEVIKTRDDDYSVSLARRAYLANSAGADLFISIHANAHPDPAISGTETYFYSWGPQGGNSRRLAQLVQGELVEHSGLRDIGVKHGNFDVIRLTRMPAILVELAFLSNGHDENLLRQDSFLDGQARAIKEGIISYYDDR